LVLFGCLRSDNMPYDVQLSLGIHFFQLTLSLLIPMLCAWWMKRILFDN